MPRHIIGYNVYYAPDGCSERFLGRVTTLEQACKLGESSPGIESCLYETMRNAGGLSEMLVPDKSGELDDGFEWFGDDGYTVAVPIAENVSEHASDER